MNPDDYAIIIGLGRYPGLTNLEGPENDARAFCQWVVSPDGGGVPNDAQHVQCILSSNYNPGSFEVWDALPIVSQIESVFRKLHAVHLQNIDKKGTPRIGRRLYIYMAGHGIAPSSSGEVNQYESALLMANVSPFSFGPTFQIPGAYTATWFGLNDCFEEIFLFMDCCRGVEWVPGINAFLPAQGDSTKAKRCYAFSTKWSQNAREKPMPDEAGNVRGIFTKTLLMGLSGGAAHANPANPKEGVITVSSLKSFLYANMEKVANQFSVNGAAHANGNLDLSDEEEVQEPDIDYWPRKNEGRDIVLKTLPTLPKFPVTVRPPAGKPPGRVRIYTHLNNEMTRVERNNSLSKDWEIRLPRGLYLAIFEDDSDNGDSEINVNFEVTGLEGMGQIPPQLITF